MEIQIINQITGNNSKNSLPTAFKVIINDYDTVNDLKRVIIRTLRLKYSINRINLHYNNPITNQVIQLSTSFKPLVSYPLFKEKIKVYVTDSGYQIKKTTSRIIQYLFPLVHIILLYYKEDLQPKNLTQRLCMMMSTTHFLKNILQNLFVKNYNMSNGDTDSISNLIIKCVFYWILYAIVCGHEIFNKEYSEPDWSTMRYAFVIGFFLCEYFNFVLSIMYSNNKKNSFFFKFLICPFYFFEMLSWICFTIFTGSITLIIFTFGISFKLIQDSLAIKEEEDLKKRGTASSQQKGGYQYDNKNSFSYQNESPKKYAIIPFIL